MFADDTSALISNHFIQMFNSAVSDICKCFQANQLIINVEKTNTV